MGLYGDFVQDEGSSRSELVEAVVIRTLYARTE